MNTEDIQAWTADIKDTAHAMLKDHDNYGEDLDTTRGVWGRPTYVRHEPMHAIVLTLDMGPREVDSLIVVGFVNPHDANLTVVINHMDALLTNDNAEEMFG